MADTPSGGSSSLTQDERTMATLAHALQLIGSGIGPLVIFFEKWPAESSTWSWLHQSRAGRMGRVSPHGTACTQLVEDGARGCAAGLPFLSHSRRLSRLESFDDLLECRVGSQRLELRVFR